MTDLFTPLKLGNVETKNRVYMAPLTRNRADNETDMPNELSPKYYGQRASGGLIITEAAQISPQGKGYVSTPGIYNEEQAREWKKSVDAVHEKGGKIFIQLWHVGRISHTSLQPDGQKPVAPSAIRAQGQTYTENGQEDVSEPRALDTNEIKDIVADYKKASQFAKEAGFDGIEVHAANGYLIDQFLRDKTNKRDDAYGGSVENRARFLFEVLDAVTSVWSPEKVGVRLAPTGTFNDMGDSDPLTHFGYVIDKLNSYNLAYLHMVERFPGMETTNEDEKIVRDLRAKWTGLYIGNGDYDLPSAQNAIESGYADAITFGRPFIANPDLPERLQKGAKLNSPDQSTFYGGGKKGYTDYPFMDESKAA